MAVMMKAAGTAKQILRVGTCLFTALAIVAPQIARAEERAPLLLAPAASSPPVANLAVSFELRFQVAQGTDLADLLLQAGVDSDDIDAATRLAAGHDGGRAGCNVKIALSKPIHETAFKLQRVTLMTETSQTIMERRKGELVISATGQRKPFRIV